MSFSFGPRWSKRSLMEDTRRSPGTESRARPERCAAGGPPRRRRGPRAALGAAALMASVLLLLLGGVGSPASSSPGVALGHIEAGRALASVIPEKAFTVRRAGARRGRAISERREPHAPALVGQPHSVSVAPGQYAKFKAAASGTPKPTVQWQLSTNSGERWHNVPGVSQATFAFMAVAAQNGDEFRAVFKNAHGKATTRAAALTVDTALSAAVNSRAADAPLITEQPQGHAVQAGTNVSFTAAAAGNPVPAVQWQVSSNSGGTWVNVAGALSSTYKFAASVGENHNEYRAVFTNGLGAVITEPAILAVNYGFSANWSGYVALEQAPYSSVSASWTVPTATCPASSTNYSAQWVGIDGLGDDSVEQDGTDAACINGDAQYWAWFEMYGDTAVNSGNPETVSYPVSPGDQITASVSVVGSNWTLAVADSSQTPAWSFTTTVPAPSPPPRQTSAEWIVERPELCQGSSSCALGSLAQFTPVTFANATATADGSSQSIAALDGVPVEMTSSDSNSTILAQPGALDNTGASFTDDWFASD
jgi:hypothetical protein